MFSFHLALKFLKETKSILRSSLWSGAALKQTVAKVSLEFVCSPKSEGGLGFKVPKVWNKASTLRYLWAIRKKEDTLWVQSVNNFAMKEKNLWQLTHNSSWTLRKIFKHGELAQPLIKCVVGKGNATCLWLDNWHPVLDLCLKATVKELLGT